MCKNKNNLSKIDKSKRRKNESKQSKGDRETKRRALEKILALMSACVDVGGERQEAEHGDSFSLEK